MDINLEFSAKAMTVYSSCLSWTQRMLVSIARLIFDSPWHTYTKYLYLLDFSVAHVL